MDRTDGLEGVTIGASGSSGEEYLVAPGSPGLFFLANDVAGGSWGTSGFVVVQMELQDGNWVNVKSLTADGTSTIDIPAGRKLKVVWGGTGFTSPINYVLQPIGGY